MTKSVLAYSVCALAPFLLSAASSSNDTSANPSRVIAEINGKKVTLGEFEQQRADKLFQARNAYYQAERKLLDEAVDEYLLADQAKQENLTVEQLLERHVKNTLPKDPPEEALRVYYEGLDAKEPYEALRGQILEHIRQVRFERAKAAYLASLRSRANLVINLPPPRAQIQLENTPVLGARNAPVMVVEYADYECPYCQQVAPAILKLQTEYKGRVAFAYKDTPLPMHAHAEKAAEAAQCAGVQGKYWDFHDTLFSSNRLDINDLKQDARKLSLDGAAFDKCLDSGAEAGKVQSELSEAQALALAGTPAFFVNGRYLSGALSYEQLRAAIEEELAVVAAQPKETAMR
jgi:protein-disulfide isomerase